jgi:AraC-like DNA-binding protein
MSITILPEQLPLQHKKGLQLFDYKNYENIQKTKINLSKNTISFLRTGNKEVIGEDAIVQIDSQHFLIMKSGNCLMTEKVSSASQIYQSILFFFSDEDALNFLEKHQLYTPSIIEDKSFYVFQYDAFIQHFVAGLEQILSLPLATQSKLLPIKFEEIMLYLSYKDKALFLNTLVQHIDDKISRLVNIVNHNKYHKLTLEELAFLSNMSISTFKRLFFKHYQTTPMKWFSSQRLQHVAFLLKTTPQRPIELYDTAGYENFSNFVQAFKKQFGMTPKQYKNKG